MRILEDIMENQPYNDDFMIYDEQLGQYVLTEKYAFEKLGLSLFDNANDRNAPNVQIAVKRILVQCSNMIYNYIHQFSFYNQRQDYWIATLPSARKMIMRAMGEQLLYMSMVGDLSRSTDPQKRNFSIDENAKRVLEQTLPEIRKSILYGGVR
jgi:hypothetical protein